MKSSPLMRVFRPDKLVLSSLEATLMEYLDARSACKNIPVIDMIFAKKELLRLRAEELKAMLDSNSADGLSIELIELKSAVGGGSLPGEVMPSWGIAISSTSFTAGEIERFFRLSEHAIIGRISKDKYILDIRTVFEHQYAKISQVFAAYLNSREN